MRITFGSNPVVTLPTGSGGSRTVAVGMPGEHDSRAGAQGSGAGARWALGLGPLALDLYLPGLPQLTTDLRTSEAAGQLSLSLCMIGLALGQLLVGPLTDRVGRRGPLLVGVGLFGVSAALCAITPSIELLLLLGLCTGLAGGAGIVMARAMVRDLYDGDTVARVFALLMLVSRDRPGAGAGARRSVVADHRLARGVPGCSPR